MNKLKLSLTQLCNELINCFKNVSVGNINSSSLYTVHNSTIKHWQEDKKCTLDSARQTYFCWEQWSFHSLHWIKVSISHCINKPLDLEECASKTLRSYLNWCSCTLLKQCLSMSGPKDPHTLVHIKPWQGL